MWEKEKMLATSISSFSHNVFYPLKNKIKNNIQFNKHIYFVVCKWFQCSGLNSLPKDKILDWSKLKAYADDKINTNENMKFVL